MKLKGHVIHVAFTISGY